MPVRVRGPAACRVPDAYASPMQAEGGNRSERFIRACSSQCVRVATNQRDRFEPAAHAVSNQQLHARAASGKERRAISRAQHPRPARGMPLVRSVAMQTKMLTRCDQIIGPPGDGTRSRCIEHN
jgi:hypothetical protein